jgi:nitrogen fixation/metabolism regulation signal transduction histidine kinase
VTEGNETPLEALEPPQPPEPPAPDEVPSTGLKMFGFVVVLGVLAVIGLVLYRIYPADHSHKRNPGFVDSIFENNLVLFASRLVLFCVAVVLAITAAYVIASIFNHWFKHKQWITSFGPFQVAEKAVEELVAQIDFLQKAYGSANEEIQRLTNQIEQSTDAYDALVGAYVETQAELTELREQQQDEG